MKRLLAMLLAGTMLLCLGTMAGAETTQIPGDSTLVPVADFAPELRQSLAYATADNFTGQQIYQSAAAFLRYGTLKKLMKAQEELEQYGFSLVLWDAFRPISAQRKLWEIRPDPRYVANPSTGGSAHSRGNTVDVTLVDAQGNRVEMPSVFDDFSPLADRDYSDCSETAGANARLLESVMEKHGFQGYANEWWHFADQDPYPTEWSFTPVTAALGEPECQEYISLRSAPDTNAEVLTTILKGERFLIIAADGDFDYIKYGGIYGYVLRAFTRRVTEQNGANLEPLFFEALRSDGGQSESAGYRLAEAFRQNPETVARALAQMEEGDIDSITALIVSEYPTGDRQDLYAAVQSIPEDGCWMVVRSFQNMLESVF